MNERFLYYPCQGEEEAWSLCMGGFPSTPAVITLHTTMSNIGNTVYGLVCRVAVGTVVENVEEEDAKQRSVYCEETGEVHVPAWRCYPEYLCQRLL
ncbi:hypothetical protein AGDE_16122 [Angomonas deanei]|nr:hypothetical protein AGDE_16122 [Angomonas deanei]|eukprot:EPY17688.1 hypothetical protein AGDE_16122 [Angomonas deanei]